MYRIEKREGSLVIAKVRHLYASFTNFLKRKFVPEYCGASCI